MLPCFGIVAGSIVVRDTGGFQMMRGAVMLLTVGLIAAGFGLPCEAMAQPATPAAAPAAASAPAPAPPAPLQLSNTVHCVFDMMPAEDREIAMLLLENEILSDGEFDPNSNNVKVIDRLIGDAQGKCDLAFRWSKGRTTAAKDYALSALFNDGLGQFIELMGQEVKPIKTYFANHKQQLAGSSNVKGVAALHFKTYLVEQGWDEDDKGRLGIGVSYLETLIAQDGYIQQFAAAPSHAVPVRAAAKPRTRASRPRKARRETP